MKREDMRWPIDKRGRRLLAAVAAFFCIVGAHAWAREVSITILHTCDLHGNVLPTESYEGKTNVGGIARCATMIRQIRSQEKNVLLLDAGRHAPGHSGQFSQRRPSDGEVFQPIALRCLDVGQSRVRLGIKQAGRLRRAGRGAIVVANIRGATGGGNPISRRIVSQLKPYIVRDIDGVKVGIIGLDTPVSELEPATADRRVGV